MALSDAQRNLSLRALSAVVLAAVALSADYVGGWAFKGLVLILVLGIVYEWYDMTGAAGRWAAMAATVAIWAAMSVHVSVYLALYCTIMGAIGASLFALLFRRGEGGGWSAAGVVYGAMPMIALLWIRPAEGGDLAIFWLFLVVWMTDTGAFAFGKTIGGPKLAPRISPSKTWSGALGGLFTAGLFGAVAGQLMLDMPMLVGAMAGVLVSIAGQGGDLLESFIKRRFNVKDSSTLVPGHGGLMDRLDSLVVAAPFFALIVVLGILSPGGG